MEEKIEKLLSNGILIIDKPCSQTSHEITSFVKKITKSQRAGHAGTLDPKVSGVLPVAIGRATKLLRYIAGKRKTYIGIMKFKIPPSRDSIRLLFRDFTGEIEQIPPKKSAVKRRKRKRMVYELKFLEQNENLVLFKAEVEAGTYIRTLCSDIGKQCKGARMEELRRVSVGSIKEEKSIIVQDLIDAMHAWETEGDASLLERMICNPEDLIDLSRVQVKENAVESIVSGAQIMIPAIENFDDKIKTGDCVAIYSKGQFLGVGIAQLASEDVGSRNRGIAVKLERVHKP